MWMEGLAGYESALVAGPCKNLPQTEHAREKLRAEAKVHGQPWHVLYVCPDSWPELCHPSHGPSLQQ